MSFILAALLAASSVVSARTTPGASRRPVVLDNPFAQARSLDGGIASEGVRDPGLRISSLESQGLVAPSEGEASRSVEPGADRFTGWRQASDRKAGPAKLNHSFDLSRRDGPGVTDVGFGGYGSFMKPMEASGPHRSAYVPIVGLDPTENVLGGLQPWKRKIMEKAIPVIDHFGERYGVYGLLKDAGVHEPRAFILSLIQAESNFNPNAKSPVGATGLMQVMPGTASGLGVRGQLTDISNNVRAGMKYLSIALGELGRPDYALYAYNCGIGCARGSLKRNGRMPKIKETTRYVKQILSTYADWVGGPAVAYIRPLIAAIPTIS